MNANNFLKKKHLDEFAGSAIPEPWAVANFFSISDLKQIAQWLGWKKYLHTPGWIAQGIDIESGKLSKFGQFKPDSILEFPDGSTAKYLTQKQGYDAFLPVYPTEADFWLKVKDDLDHPIRITEGAKKAIASTVEGRPTIGLCGVDMGCVNNRIELVNNLKPFINPGRPIEIAFDADIIRKPEVADALRAFGKALSHQGGREIFVRVWDEKLGKGIDDLIVAGHDLEAVSHLIKFERWIELHF